MTLVILFVMNPLRGRVKLQSSFIKRSRTLGMKHIVKAVGRRISESVRVLRSRKDFYGIHRNFAAATRACPNSKVNGYDQPGAAGWYLDKLNGIWHDDYPALYWMS